MALERVPMTKEGQDKLKKDLLYLKSVERPKTVTELEEARAHGDLSENAEYHAAREKLGHIDGRVMELEEKLSKAEVIDPTLVPDKNKIAFGATVSMVDLENDSKIKYQIVGDYEADIQAGKISINSPIARGLIGKKLNDEVKITTPKGVRELEVLQIEYK